MLPTMPTLIGLSRGLPPESTWTYDCVPAVTTADVGTASTFSFEPVTIEMSALEPAKRLLAEEGSTTTTG